MTKLLLLNAVLLCILVPAAVLSVKKVKSEKGRARLLLLASLLTVLCHYSSLLYHAAGDGEVLRYLEYNPNLILPIYPCNAVMWCCVIFGFMKNKKSRTGRFLADYIFWFGLPACAFGMLVNIDFLRDPDLANFDAVKSTVAHAFMLYNVLLLRPFGHVKTELRTNMLHILIAEGMMLLLGLYCTLVFWVLSGKEAAYSVNSMFILSSPFESLPFLRYPVIALAALAVYFVILTVCGRISGKRKKEQVQRP